MSVDNSSASQMAATDSSRRVAGAIKQASNQTGVSFEYMLTTAKMESDFDPSAGATTSSAHGLYQFIDQTWLGTVKEAGTQLGYGNYSDAITRTSSGTYTVDDPFMKRSIMKLRDDPEAASSMAAALTQSNSFKLTGLLGRRPCDSELYMAHFMGVGGAAKLIANAEDNPQAVGARLFPNAASANRSIFYAKDGRARSVSEVYSVLNARYASASNAKSTRSAMAMYGDTPSTTQVASANAVQPTVPMVNGAAYLQTFPDARGVTPVSATSSTNGGRQYTGHAGIPFDLPARRCDAAGLNDGTEIVGQQRLAHLRCISDARCASAATARSVQRSQRHVLQLTRDRNRWAASGT
ncbi:hypothetical protein ACVWYH_007769 [Bradyrhizobium sp. GM24.11]